MEKKTFKIVGSYNLRKAFIEDNAFNQYDKIVKSYFKTLEDYDALTIHYESNSLQGINSVDDDTDITYILPQDWDAAVKACKEVFKPEMITFNEGDYVWNLLTKCIDRRCNESIKLPGDMARKATIEEIKAYLIEEAKKRGFTKENSDKIKFNCALHDNRVDYNFTYNEGWQYFPGEDALSMLFNQYFYSKGKWAEVKPIYKTLYFGSLSEEKLCGDKIEFRCYKGHAETPEGRVTVDDFKFLDGKQYLLGMEITINELSEVHIGKYAGTIKELQAIYEAIK